MLGCSRVCWWVVGAALLVGSVIGRAEPGVREEKHVLRGLVYAEIDGFALKLDLHLPVRSERPLPVVLWLHAGGWREGGRGFCPIANLAKEGFAVASVSYRLSGQAKFPAQIEDAKAAVRWLRAHALDYNLDPARIGACGESAGGHLAAMLGVTGDDPAFEGTVGGDPEFSSAVQAVVALCPPSDFTSMLERRRERSFWAKLFTSGNLTQATYVFVRTRALRQLFGGALPSRAEQVRHASPLRHVSAKSAPMLLFHGRHDWLIPLRQSEALQRALQAAGVEAKLAVLETPGHGIGRFPPTMMAETRAFFGRHLRDECATRD